MAKIRIASLGSIQSEENILYNNLLQNIALSLDIKIIPIAYTVPSLNPQSLDEAYKRNDYSLLDFYQKIEKICNDSQVNVLLIQQNLPVHPDFIQKIRSQNIKTILWVGDDPESSFLYTVPYVHAHDMVFCYGVYYDNKTLIKDRILQWGAKKAHFMPFGVKDYKMTEKLEPREFVQQRSNDIVYVGNYYENKIDRLLELKKVYGKRFQVYGRSWGNFSVALKRAIKTGTYIKPKAVSVAHQLEIYQSTKIGINFHMSYGPSNVRLFELPANGVLQITDNPKGTGKLYELGKEVVCYEDIAEVPRIIDYYLSHEDQRAEIAYQGYLKTYWLYKHSSIWIKIVNIIRQELIIN